MRKMLIQWKRTKSSLIFWTSSYPFKWWISFCRPAFGTSFLFCIHLPHPLSIPLGEHSALRGGRWGGNNDAFLESPPFFFSFRLRRIFSLSVHSDMLFCHKLFPVTTIMGCATTTMTWTTTLIAILTDSYIEDSRVLSRASRIKYFSSFLYVWFFYMINLVFNKSTELVRYIEDTRSYYPVFWY